MRKHDIGLAQELMTEKLATMRPMQEYPFLESLMIEPTGSTLVEDPTDKQERELVLFVSHPFFTTPYPEVIHVGIFLLKHTRNTTA